MGRCRHLGLLALLLVARAAPAAEELQAVIRLQPADVMSVDEVAVLTIHYEGGDPDGEPFPMFDLDNFREVRSMRQSSSIVIRDGERSIRRTLSWHLQPRTPGRARVHGASLTVGGQIRLLADCEVEVVASSPDRQRTRELEERLSPEEPDDPFERLLRSSERRRERYAQPPSPPKVFLWAEVVPPDPWVGQQVLYTLYLFTQVNIETLPPDEMPDFQGFWVREISLPAQRPQPVMRDGERYGKAILLQRAIFPLRSGRFELAPVHARLKAEMPARVPFGQSAPPGRLEITRVSNRVTVEVRELPPAPPGFQGAVGELALGAELQPEEVAAGEAATLVLTLSGKGNLQGISAPRVPELAGIEVFSPQQRSDERLVGREVHGTRSWSFVLVPERRGRWQLPAIEIPYFDPDREEYRTAVSPALELVVGGARPAAGEPRKPHSIRTAALPREEGGSSFSGLLPWSFALPWVLGAVVLWLRHRSAGRGAGPARRRLMARLAEAAAEERPRPAAAQIEDAWRDFLDQRWEIPSGTPSTQWGALLVARGVPAAGARELVKLADDLHYLRYAPKLSAVSELRRDVIERSRKLIRTVG